MEQPTCLLCGSNEDYLCYDHQETVSNFDTQANTTLMAVIGTTLPRSIDIGPDEVPMISTHANLEEFHKMLDEWEKDGVDVASYSFLVRFTKGIVSSLTPEDMTFLILTNRQISPLSLIFENDEELKEFTTKYDNHIEPSLTLPIVVIHHRLDSILEYLNDVELPNQMLTCYVSKKISSI